MKKKLVDKIAVGTLVAALLVASCGGHVMAKNTSTEEDNIPSETQTEAVIDFTAEADSRIPVIIFEQTNKEDIEDSNHASLLIEEQKNYMESMRNVLKEDEFKGLHADNPIVNIILCELITAQERIDYYTPIYEELKAEEEEAARIAEEEARKKATLYSASQFQNCGVVNWNGYRWTWYSQRVLPGGGLSIPGRHVDSNGYVCDENDYICLASSTLSKGTVLNTPFGKQGKVYDSGCAAGTVDVYVNW